MWWGMQVSALPNFKNNNLNPLRLLLTSFSSEFDELLNHSAKGNQTMQDGCVEIGLRMSMNAHGVRVFQNGVAHNSFPSIKLCVIIFIILSFCHTLSALMRGRGVPVCKCSCFPLSNSKAFPRLPTYPLPTNSPGTQAWRELCWPQRNKRRRRRK